MKLLQRIVTLETLIAKIDQTLRVPAAEYVPAIGDVFQLIDDAGLRRDGVQVCGGFATENTQKGRNMANEAEEQLVFTGSHFTDAAGNPAGGVTYGRGFTIGWQNGPLGRGEERAEPGGAFVEDVIAAVIDRIRFYQRSKFACPQNAIALDSLDNALRVLRERTESREARGVEGTHEL